MDKNKDNALNDFINMIVKSWTYDRLTEKERERCMEALRETTLKGNWNCRCEILHSVYNAFLLALDCKSIGWREDAENIPLF